MKKALRLFEWPKTDQVVALVTVDAVVYVVVGSDDS